MPEKSVSDHLRNDADRGKGSKEPDERGQMPIGQWVGDRARDDQYGVPAEVGEGRDTGLVARITHVEDHTHVKAFKLPPEGCDRFRIVGWETRFHYAKT